MENKFVYSVEIFKQWDGVDTEPYWGTDIRIYQGEKQLTDFDLIDIPNKRRNAKLIPNDRNSKTKHIRLS